MVVLKTDWGKYSLNEQQENLYKVLLMPIFEKNIESFQIHNDTICSGFTYGNTYDADMSNVAIKFYSILYGIDEKDILSSSNRHLKGDTMNSSSPYFRPASDVTSEWNIKKHCLANFWILPMDIGRTPVKHLSEEGKLYCKHSKKSKLHDYMDEFLLFMSKNIAKYYEKHEEYFHSINVDMDSFFELFPKVHYLASGYYFGNEVKVVEKIKLKQGYEIWEAMIKARAEEIAISVKWEQLYEHLVLKKQK